MSSREFQIFQEKVVPAYTKLAGWSALVKDFRIAAPVRSPVCVSNRHIKESFRHEGEWTVFDKRYDPGDSPWEHLTFALQHETLDLLILKRVFDAIPRTPMENAIRQTPSGISARRLWYFYELLTSSTLNIPNAPVATATDLIDSKDYITGKPRLSKRHRVRDNLLGNGRFCPVIRKTEALKALLHQDLAAKARETVGRTGAHLISRAASFLLLADSQASFQIEGERPPRNRLERFGRAVLQAGKNPLTLEEVVRLQEVVVGESSMIQPGLRTDNVFLGEHSPFGEPHPEFIGARPAALEDLMTGLLAANERMRDDGVDPALQAAATAFGFIYVHPFQDGNGRVHRCLFHHVLAERKFTPPGMIFPVSSVILDRIDEYRAVLQAHSGPLMPFIDWRPTFQRNVEVLNDTADLYRYFDCTAEAEFLLTCIGRAVEHDLPREIEYLRRHGAALQGIMETVEMPDRIAADFILFVRQNQGTLPKKWRSGQFQSLSDGEVAQMEGIVRESFEGFAI